MHQQSCCLRDLGSRPAWVWKFHMCAASKSPVLETVPGPITSIVVSWATGVQNDVEMRMANATMKGLDPRGPSRAIC
jgi:hypothetical protein